MNRNFVRSYYYGLLFMLVLLGGQFTPLFAQEWDVEEDTYQYEDYDYDEYNNQQYSRTNYLDEDWEKREFDEADWNRLAKELDYSGEPPKPEEKPEESPTEEDNSTPSRSWNVPDLSPLFKVLLVILAIAVIGVIIYAVIQEQNKDYSVPAKGSEIDYLAPGEIDLERIEEELDTTDVDPYLRKAEADGNYHLAVRLQYLSLLKQLHETDRIRWKKDYTNRVYLNQMRGQPDFTAFRELTLTFERVWYGDQHPDVYTYDHIRNAFTGFKQQSTKPTV